MSDELNEVRPGDRITAELLNSLIRRVKTPSTGGEGSITVPALFGLTLPSARDTVINAGLTVGKVLDAYGRELDTQPTPQPPVVISQVPAPGVRVNANHAVLIAVSAQPTTTEGPQPAPGPAIPELMHKTLAEAQVLLAQRGIQTDQIGVLDVFGRPVGANDPRKADLRIISQLPLSGTPVSQTVSVKLVTTEVAGPEMPTLVGLSLVRAKAELIRFNVLAEVRALDVAGLPVDPNDSRFNDRLVISQIPVPGRQAQAITGVNLITTASVPLPSTAPLVPNLLHLDLATTKTRLDTATIPLARVLVRDVFGALVDMNGTQNNDRLILNQHPPHGVPVVENLSMNLVATGRLPTSTPPDGGTPTPVLPQITGITPMPAPLGSEIEISGMNFEPISVNNFVTIGGAATIPAPSSTSVLLRVTVPLSAEGSPPDANGNKVVTVTVKTSAGTTSSNLLISPSVTKPPAPVINLIQPSMVPVDSEIEITGSNFDLDFTKNIVTIGGAPAFVSNVLTATRLFAVVPTNIEGGAPTNGELKSVPVTLKTAGGTASSTLGVRAAVGAPLPLIYQISPSSVVRGSNVILRTNITPAISNYSPQYIYVHFSTANNSVGQDTLWSGGQSFPFDPEGEVSVHIPDYITGLTDSTTPIAVYVRLRVYFNNVGHLVSPPSLCTVHYGSP